MNNSEAYAQNDKPEWVAPEMTRLDVDATAGNTDFTSDGSGLS